MHLCLRIPSILLAAEAVKAERSASVWEPKQRASVRSGRPRGTHWPKHQTQDTRDSHCEAPSLSEVARATLGTGMGCVTTGVYAARDLAWGWAVYTWESKV